MKSQFFGGAYQQRSLPLSAQTCVNLFPKANQRQGGEMSGFYGTPGREVLTTLPAGEGRGICPVGSNQATLIAVVGASVYAVTATTANGNSGSPPITFAYTLVGTLPTTTGRVSMATNASGQTAICDSTGMYVVANGNGSLGSKVTNGPSGGQSVIAYMDGFGLFITGGGTNESTSFGITAIDDFTTINALNVATAEALPDNLVSVVVTQREAWLLGNQTAEIWSDTGAAIFPWERIPGGVLHTGCSGLFTPAFVEDTVFWVTRTPTGKNRVVRTVGYQVEYISDYAVEESLQNYNDSLPGAETIPPWAYAYQQRGDSFYVLNIPQADITWVYHVNTGLWHRRAYRDSNGVLHAELSGAYTYWQEQHCILDPNNGNIYKLDDGTYTDNGLPIYRERAWPLVPPEELHRVRIDRIELDAETGVGNETGTDTTPLVSLEMSFDGGRTFGLSRYQGLGAIGVYNARVRWGRCGIGRRPVARISTTAEVKIAWLGANFDGEILQQ